MFQDWLERCILFLPAAGYRLSRDYQKEHAGGYYWSITPVQGYKSIAWYYRDDIVKSIDDSRPYSYAIRLATVVSELAGEC